MELIIENGILVTGRDIFKADIMLKNGKIAAIGSDFAEQPGERINADGKYIMPGAVDVHTHIDLQAGDYHTSDDFFTGTRAALCGGTTTVVEHLAFGPEGCSLRSRINEYKTAAKDKAVSDYGLHGVIQHVDADILREMGELAAEGISSFKIYMTYDFALADADILRVLEKGGELGTVTAVHCENDSIINYLRGRFAAENKKTPFYHALSRPAECETEAVCRVLRLAHMAGDAPIYIVHLSTEGGLNAVREARARGQRNIYTETCPQYLLLDENCYSNRDAVKYIMSPPLRKAADQAALWKGLSDGSIDIIATDHCPFSTADKLRGERDFTECPNGAPGVEERVMAIFSAGVAAGKITLNKFVETLCINPSRIYGLYPRKGNLLPGSDADIMIINEKGETDFSDAGLHGSAGYSLYGQKKMTGRMDAVIRRGDIVYAEDRFIGQKGTGLFIERRICR
ncbi:dihydropyrimidinase [Pectinatus haikarae]|uniref:dihydropyrimidinase n=1 Tax=Pectinatus haikarae TaxID=349096 RepID=UPI0018C71C3F|nr:dihydropyrimidinase [Pectinatus haikarae]